MKFCPLLSIKLTLDSRGTAFDEGRRKHLLLQLLPGIAHVVQFLLYVDTGVVPALEQLLSKQLQRLERACAGIHFRAMFLYDTICMFISSISYKLICAIFLITIYHKCLKNKRNLFYLYNYTNSDIHFSQTTVYIKTVNSVYILVHYYA